MNRAVNAEATSWRAPLEGKVLLVTGGGAGIGRAICIHCARAGARVAVAGPGPNTEETVAAVRAEGGTALAFRSDVTVAADVAGAVAGAVEHFGALDALVHNATSRRSSEVARVESMTDPVWADHLAVSVRGAFLCARAAFPHLERRRGAFLLMTSAAAIEGSLTLPGYAAAKGALRAMTKSLAVEWGPHGVRVNALSPLALTSALKNAYLENPQLEERLMQLTPLGRVGDPIEDIAPAVAFLVGDSARYISGQTIAVDGGRFTGL